MEIDFIKSFVESEGQFLRNLKTGMFNKEEFHKYTKAIADLSKKELTGKEKFDIAVTIWEFNLFIQSHLTWNFDQKDGYSIKNLKEDDARQISNILQISANWFSYGKEIDSSMLVIGIW